MNNEKELTCEVVTAAELSRKQKSAWRLMLLGVVLSTLSQRLLFMEPLMAVMAFLTLRKVASNRVVEMVCKRMVWVQAFLAALLLGLQLMWVELGGDILAMDLLVILGWGASVWCYAALANSETLGEDSRSWLNAIVTLIIARCCAVAFGDDDCMEAFGALYFGWAFVAAYAWRKLIGSEAFVGKELKPTAVDPKKAFGFVNKYTILALIPAVVVLILLFA